MADKNESFFIELKRRAENTLAERGRKSPDSEEMDLLRLLQELEVHQVELEIQNEELRRAQKELDSSRNDYRELFDSAPNAYLTLSSKGLVTKINAVAEEMFAGPDRILIGMAFSSLIHPGDHPVYFSCLEKVRKGQRNSCDLRMLGKKGKLIYVHMDATTGLDEADGSSPWHFSLTDITKQKEAEAALKTSNEKLETLNKELEERTAELSRRAEQLARLSSELTLAEQRERRRLAVIIHDHLQQLLVGAKIRLEIMAKRLGDEHGQELEQVYKLIVESLQSARSLSIQMAPYVLYERGLFAGLKWLARSMQETYRIRIDISTSLEKDLDNEDLKVLLFESVRELLFNVVKHSSASEACVKISQGNPDELRIVVSDRGVGFDPDKVLKISRDERFGLFSIRERLDLIGGDLEIESAPGSGTNISLIVPMEKTGPVEHPETGGVPAEEPVPAPTNTRGIRVLLVDDHAVMRQGLCALLAGYADIEVVGEASDGEEAVQMARYLRPDVVLMDISMPGMDGIEATRIIHTDSPHVRIIGLSMYDDPGTTRAIMDAGAVAFLPKSGHCDPLIAAVRGNTANPA